MISPKNKYIDIMNGIRIKVRENFDELQLWMNSGVGDKEKLEGLKSYINDRMSFFQNVTSTVIFT